MMRNAIRCSPLRIGILAHHSPAEADEDAEAKTVPPV
jgi:hypothetical protein